MASTIGHAKNVANFKELIAIVTDMGGEYNPHREDIKLTALQAVDDSAEAALEVLNMATPALLAAVNAREAAFAPLSKLATRVLYEAEADGVNSTVITSMKVLVRKLHGGRAKAKVKPDAEKSGAEEKVYVSVSQLSFDMRIEHFAELVDIVAAQSEYQPSEVSLGVEALQADLAQMRTTNDAANAAALPVADARNARNVVLYAEKTGLVDLAYSVKLYVKATFGAGSYRYKEVNKLKFTKNF